MVDEANIKTGVGINAFDGTVASGIEAIFQKYQEKNIFGKSRPAYDTVVYGYTNQVEAQHKDKFGIRENPDFVRPPISVTYNNDLSSIKISVNYEHFRKDAESLADFMLKAMPEIKPESLTIKRNYVPKNVEEMAKLYVKR